jgi:hypothetical protein
VVDLRKMPDILANEISDCHVHVVGPVDAFPQAEGRGYTAGIGHTGEFACGGGSYWREGLRFRPTELLRHG